MYLIFSSEESAWNRSEQEGISIGLSYHTQGKGSRYVTAPQEPVDDMWALAVNNYDSDEAEAETVGSSFTPKPIPEVF